MTTSKIETTVIYHSNCTDGFMSAFWFYLMDMLINKSHTMEFIACQYNKDVPVINGDKVYVVDFSFTKDQLEHPNFRNKEVIILDHHETAANVYGGYGSYDCVCCDNTTKVKALFKKEQSGAGLAEDYVTKIISKEVTDSWFIDYVKPRMKYFTSRVQDRDLWKFEYDDTKAVYELLNSIPKDFEEWYKLIICTSNQKQENLIDNMKIRIAMRTELSEDYASKALVCPYGDKTYAIVNCASNFASEVGSILSATHAFAAMFVVIPTDKIVIVSMRSKEGVGVNVSEIAKQYGGGGHVNAAGFSIPLSMIDKLINGELFN